MLAGFPSALTGKWRLVFSSPSPIKQWQYIPIPEFAEIDADAGRQGRAGRVLLALPAGKVGIGAANAVAATHSRVQLRWLRAGRSEMVDRHRSDLLTPLDSALL